MFRPLRNCWKVALPNFIFLVAVPNFIFLRVSISLDARQHLLDYSHSNKCELLRIFFNLIFISLTSSLGVFSCTQLTICILSLENVYLVFDYIIYGFVFCFGSVDQGRI